MVIQNLINKSKFFSLFRNDYFLYFIFFSLGFNRTIISTIFLSIYIIFNLEKIKTHIILNKRFIILSSLFLGFLLSVYFIGDAFDLPISIFALGGAIIFLIIATLQKAVEPKHIIKEAPWQVVWFSIGLYIVVYGLKNAGLTDYLTIILKDLALRGDTIAIIGTGFLSAFLSAIMNNMPTVMIMDIALKDIPNEALAYANIIGCNLGPKMTPFGSLATLLWLHVLAKKGVKIGFWEYSKFGLIITPPVLFIVLLFI